MTFSHNKSVINSSVLPTPSFLTNGRVDDISIGNDDIISLIRKVNLNKATGPDGVSGQMIGPDGVSGQMILL